MIRFDHMQIEAKDIQRTARLLADLLGCAPPDAEGQEDDMFRVDLDQGSFVLFTKAPEPRFAHVAFRVDGTRFAATVERLQSKGIPFGNHHADTENRRTTDPLGGSGRVYFHDENGHLWEVTC